MLALLAGRSFWGMKKVIQNKRVLFVLLFLITLVMAYGLTQLRIDFRFDGFYPKDHPDSQYYADFQASFSEDQNYMYFIALKAPGVDVFDPTFLEEFDNTFQELAKVEGIDSMICATTFPFIRRSGLGVSSRPILPYTDSSAIRRAIRNIERDIHFVGSFISQDRRYAFGYLFLTPALFDSPERDKVSAAIEEILEPYPEEVIINGIPYIRSQYIKKIGWEMQQFLVLTISLIMLVLGIMYRSFWGVVIPMAVVLLSLVWVLGFMTLTGESVNLISNLLIPIMFVVGTSDVIHLMTKYVQELRSGMDRQTAIYSTLTKIGFAVLLTSITTAIGFASLTVSRVPPISIFGTYASVGVLFTYLITIIVLPNALLFIKGNALSERKNLSNHPFWENLMLRVYRLTKEQAKPLAGIFSVVILACVLLIFRIPLEIYLIEDIGKNDPLRKGMEFFEEQGFGVRPFEMCVHVEEGVSMTDRDMLEDLLKIQGFLAEQVRFSPFLSLPTFISEANFVDHFRRPQYRKIPASQAEVDELFFFAQTRGGDSLFQQVMDPEKRTLRLSSRLGDIGTEGFTKIYTALDTFIQEHCDTSKFSYRFTGHAHLTELNLQYLQSSLIGGLAIAFLVIGVIMGLMFKSWKMLLVSMVPNIVPLIMTGGVMGLFSINLTTSTAIIFVIAFGIAVDDTIHFLTRYRQEIAKGEGIEEAIKQTLLGTGKAMLITSFVLISGFILLLTSTFGGTYNTGLFTALTILFALFADLLLLPVLLRWIFSNEE